MVTHTGCCDPTSSTPEEDAFWERAEAWADANGLTARPGGRSMKEWVEVWGVEEGEAPPPVLLYKLPARMVTTGEVGAVVNDLAAAGATWLTVRRVKE